MRRAGRPRNLAAAEVNARFPDCERHRRLEHRDVDELTSTVALAGAKSREGRDRRIERGGQVRDRDTDLHRDATLFAGDAHEPALALNDDVERGPIGVRAVESPAGDGDVDKARVRLEERGRREAEVIHGPRAQILDDHVRSAGEPFEDLAAFLAFEVDREAAFVAVESREVTALSGGEGLQEPGEVAGFRMLDLHDVGAEVGELHPAERARHVVADLDHTDARKGRGA